MKDCHTCFYKEQKQSSVPCSSCDLYNNHVPISAFLDQPIEVMKLAGITIRDYFAAQAMQGIYAAVLFPTGMMADTAKEAYEMADAMMEARK
jgi:hypothetical protein